MSLVLCSSIRIGVLRGNALKRGIVAHSESCSKLETYCRGLNNHQNYGPIFQNTATIAFTANGPEFDIGNYSGPDIISSASEL